MTRGCVAILVLAAAAAVGAAGPTDGVDAVDTLDALEAPFRDVFDRCAGSVVRVGPRSDAPMLTGTPVGTVRVSFPPPSAGVALAPEWVLAHVSRERRSDHMSVATMEGKLLGGVVKARIESPPLLLIHVPGAKLTPVPLGAPDTLPVGSWVMMLGNAFGTGSTGGPPVTLGLVCGRIRTEGGPTTFAVSAAANPGDAGGAVFDASGRLIGIMTGRRSVGDVAEAISVDDVLAKMGEVEGFAAVRATGPVTDDPAAVLSRHIQSLARGLDAAIVSLLVKRTTGAEKALPGPVREGQSLLERFPVTDRAVSGFIVDDRGTIVTSYVNLADALGRLETDDGTSLLESVEAVLPGGRVVPARLIGAHEGKGIAVLRIEADGLVAAPLGVGRSMTVGRWLLTLGNPYGKERTDAPFVGFGIVSDLACEPARYDALLTDAPVNVANVGGPVVDMRGRVIGVSTAVVSPRDTSMRYGLNSGIGFVIPIEDVMALIPRLEAEGVVRFRPGFLGVRLEQSPEPEGGVRISSVIPATGAARGGLRVGDVILSINGTEVADGVELRRILYGLAPGTKVTLAIRRGERVLPFEIQISLRPDASR